LVSLFDMVAACVAGTGLSITSVGRRLPGPTTLKHKIKRADRVIGNPHLYRERTAIYGALCRGGKGARIEWRPVKTALNDISDLHSNPAPSFWKISDSPPDSSGFRLSSGASRPASGPRKLLFL
jgi:hypothetical protein